MRPNLFLSSDLFAPRQRAGNCTLCWPGYPDTRPARKFSSSKVTDSQASSMFVPRHCASVVLINPVRGQIQPSSSLRTATLRRCGFDKSSKGTASHSSSSSVPRHSYTPKKLYHDGKNRAMLRSLRPPEASCFTRGDTTFRPPLATQHKRPLLPGR